MRFYFKIFTLFVLFNLAERLQFSLMHKLLWNLSPTEIFYSFLFGLRFDMAVSAVFSSLIYVLYYARQRLTRFNIDTALFYTCITLGTLLFIIHTGDTIYYFESGRHVGYEGLAMVHETRELTQVGFTQYWYVILVNMFILTGFYLAVKRLLKRQSYDVSVNGWKSLVLEIKFVSLLVFAVICLRGGFQPIIMAPLNAAEMGNFNQSAIALNGSYNFLYAVSTGSRAGQETRINFALDSVTRNLIFNQMYKPSPSVKNRPFARHNVVLIFLESWPLVKMEKTFQGKEVTPFYNSLKRKSLVTRGLLAGGHRTAEGVFSTLCSTQNPLGMAIPNTQLALNDYLCLPKILADQGYRNLFFQGTWENLTGMGSLVKKLGFQESYGKEHIKNRKYEEKVWGVQDHDIYDFMFEKIRQTPEPFFIGVNTNTTHDIHLPEGVKSEIIEDKVLGVLHFADEQLGEFFSKAEKEPWFANTVFVLVSDHTNYVHSSRIQQYLLPFLIYAPSLVQPQKIERVTTQRDIAPTILDILHFPGDLPSFTGKSLMGSGEPPYFSDYYHEGILGWVENNRLIEIPIGNPEKFVCADIQNDIFNPEEVACDRQALDMRRRAIVFTDMVQDLLFSGKSTMFKNRFLSFDPGSLPPASLHPEK